MTNYLVTRLERLKKVTKILVSADGNPAEILTGYPSNIITELLLLNEHIRTWLNYCNVAYLLKARSVEAEK
jgi:hypothetical protein